MYTRKLKALIFALPLLALASSAQALTCPLPHPEAQPGVIKEPQATLREYASMLTGDDQANSVGVIVTDLRKKYPQVTNTELVNYLTTAYCPAIEAEGYSSSAATAKIGNFSKLVEARLSE